MTIITTKSHQAPLTAMEIEAAIAPRLMKEHPNWRIIAGSFRCDENGSFVVNVEQARASNKAPKLVPKSAMVKRKRKTAPNAFASPAKKLSGGAAPNTGEASVDATRRGPGRPRKDAEGKGTEAPAPAAKTSSNRGWPKGKPRGPRKPKEEPANVIPLNGESANGDAGKRDELLAKALANDEAQGAASDVDPQDSPETESQVPQGEEVG